MKRIIVLLAAVALTACQSYETVNRSELYIQEHLKEVEGSVLGVYPPEIDYGAIRFTVDLREATLKIGDQEVSLATRFVDEVDDDQYGRLGILDGDIFSKSGLSEEYLSELAAELLIAGIQGEKDYNVPYFKGFGTGNMGYLSNRAVSWDTTTYPAKPVFSGEQVPTVFTDVIPLEEGQDPDSAGVDYVLHSEITMNSEISQIIEESASSSLAMNEKPREGEYYLFLQAGIWASLEDPAGNVIFDSNTDIQYPLGTMDDKVIKIPVEEGDSEAYAEYFRNMDFSELAKDTLEEFVPRIYPLVANVYVNYSERIVIEEE